MEKFVVALICLLIPSPAFSSVRGFTLFSSGCEHERVSVAVRNQQLFDANSWNQSASQGTPSNPAAKQKQGPKQRPHMIELTSANWRPLTRSEKFELFSHDLLRWETHASIAFDSGLSFATGDRPYLGDGAKGYFSRYGLNVADEANFTFFNAFVFPTVFHQDPRYIPRDGGSTKARLAYALTRVLITRADSGKSEVNRSRILGVFFSTSISSAMYSSYGADVGVGGNFVAFGYNMATEAAFNILKEFWPDVARKMKLSLWLRNIVRASLRDYVRVS